MNSQVCVTCRNEKPVNRTDNRLVTESCGHVKCMDCLLLEKAGCEACLLQKSEQVIADVSDTDDGFAGDTVPAPAEMKRFEEISNDFEETSKEFVVINNGFKETNTEFVLTNNGFEETNNGFEETNNEVQIIFEDLNASGKFYLCTVCKKRFHARSHVAYHAYCNGQSKPYACVLCPQSFASQSHYKYHMRVHRNERPYVCDVCGQNFVQTSKLQRHKLKHTKEKKHTCVQCNKAFTNMTALRKHMLIHTEERPYACPTCGRRFRDNSNFQKHVKKHNNCEYVAINKAFTNMTALRKHMLIHTEERPYACPTCGRRFRDNSNFQKHVKKHNN
ncbi:Uncharacterized protein OBRU01_18843, partial [Operophtera brumata]